MIVLAYAIMSNHFHIFIYVPVRPETKRSERPRDLQPIYEKTEF